MLVYKGVVKGIEINRARMLSSESRKVGRIGAELRALGGLVARLRLSKTRDPSDARFLLSSAPWRILYREQETAVDAEVDESTETGESEGLIYHERREGMLCTNEGSLRVKGLDLKRKLAGGEGCRHRRSRRVGLFRFRFLDSCHHLLSPQLTLQAHIMSSSLLSHKSIRLQKNTRGATSLDKNGEVRPDHALTARLQQAKHITKSILHYYKVSYIPSALSPVFPPSSRIPQHPPAMTQPWPPRHVES